MFIYMGSSEISFLFKCESTRFHFYLYGGPRNFIFIHSEVHEISSLLMWGVYKLESGFWLQKVWKPLFKNMATSLLFKLQARNNKTTPFERHMDCI